MKPSKQPILTTNFAGFELPDVQFFETTMLPSTVGNLRETGKVHPIPKGCYQWRMASINLLMVGLRQNAASKKYKRATTAGKPYGYRIEETDIVRRQQLWELIGATHHFCLVPFEMVGISRRLGNQQHLVTRPGEVRMLTQQEFVTGVEAGSESQLLMLGFWRPRSVVAMAKISIQTNTEIEAAACAPLPPPQPAKAEDSKIEESDPVVATAPTATHTPETTTADPAVTVTDIAIATSVPTEQTLVKIEKPKRKKVKKAWVLEIAKSGRSKCHKCQETIEKGSLRMGVLTFYPHRNCKWHHFGQCMYEVILGATIDRVWGLSKLESEIKTDLEQQLITINTTVVRTSIPTITGELDMGRFASALTERYQRFRSFRFGLPEDQKYSKNWNWRCFLATMLVCNTHETAMLAVTDKLFKAYPTPEALDKLSGDRETQRQWLDCMKQHDLRHGGKKTAFILRANRKLIQQYEGQVPKEREDLQEMNGVGRHVASITMAWVHQKPEFGIDTHVKRILQRWEYITPEMTDVEVERKVKRLIPEKQIGHFSRAFVDHGQQVCGFTPDCANCFLRGSCPTAAKHLEW